ncbi:MAG: hypothetical protein ABL967_08820 [Bryobacteraceae bacterium]
MIPQETIAALGAPSPAKTKTQSMDVLLASKWARLFVPSLSDLFFLAMIGWLFMGAYGWSGLLADGDVGWHIRTGEYILDNHSVPHTDLYSFSKPGAPWYAWEWLSDVIDAALFRVAGLKGVVLPAGILIALFGTSLIRRILRYDVNMFVAIAIAMFGVVSASVHFLARPHIFTLILLSLSMWMIETDRDGTANPKRIWLLIPLSMIWTNLHGGFLVLVAVLGLTAAGNAIEALLSEAPLKDKDWQPAIRYASLTVGCAAVSLVNPYGWGLHQHVLEYLQSSWIQNVIQEFQSPSFRGENMKQFEILLFTGLMAAGELIRRRRIAEGLWILFFAYEALSSARHVPIFAAVAVPLIAVAVSGWWKALTGGVSKNSLIGIINKMAAETVQGFRRSSIWPVAAVIALIFIDAPVKWPKDFPQELFPTDIIHKHEREIFQSRLLTTDQWGDYLIFLHPEYKVFVDGRSDFYGPEVGNEYIALTNGSWNWQKLFEKYKFNMVLLPVELPAVQLLKQRSDWHVLADDGKRILLAPRQNTVAPNRASLVGLRF